MSYLFPISQKWVYHLRWEFILQPRQIGLNKLEKEVPFECLVIIFNRIFKSIFSKDNGFQFQQKNSVFELS